MEVTKIGDKDMSCSQIANEVVDVKIVKKDIDDKTGVSGRNVGMAILFWPGIIVNEVNADRAEDLANERINKLIGMYEEKKCDKSILSEAEAKMAEREKELEEKAKEEAAKNSANSSN